MMSVTEFGHRLGISPASAYRLVASGAVQIVDVGTGRRMRMRVTEEALTEFLQRRRVV
jgi:predicted site-specific integrase-resolvase